MGGLAGCKGGLKKGKRTPGLKREGGDRAKKEWGRSTARQNLKASREKKRNLQNSAITRGEGTENETSSPEEEEIQLLGSGPPAGGKGIKKESMTSKQEKKIFCCGCDV